MQNFNGKFHRDMPIYFMLMSEINKKNLKCLLPSLDALSEILSISSCIVNIPAIDHKDGLAFLSKNNNNFMLDIETKRPMTDEFKKQFQIVMSTKGQEYISENVLFRKEKPQFNKNNLKYTLELNNIIKGNPKNDLFFRMVLPVEIDILCAFFLPMQSFNWEKESRFGLIKTHINNCIYDIYEVSYNKLFYLFIDCSSKSNINDFYNQSISILVSLGFFTSFFIQDECFILGSSDKEYHTIEFIEYRSLRDSITIPFRFLDNNSYDIFDIKEAASQIVNTPKIQQEPFDALVNLCYNNQDIFNCLFVYIASSCYPLDTRPACLAVVMEGICNYILKKDEERLNPIKDKEVAKEIRKKIIVLLDGYKDIIDKDDFLTLLKRIDNLNQPTNNEKLLRPYELLGIKLKSYEIKAIENRNNFLHANLQIKIGRDIDNSSSIAHQLFFTCNVLERLFYKLVLKLINYKGTMLNNIIINEHIFGKIPDEKSLIEL